MARLRAFTQNFSYGPFRRLQSITDSAAGTTLQRSFNYDAYGNGWVVRNDNGLPYDPRTPTTDAYNGNNQIPIPTLLWRSTWAGK